MGLLERAVSSATVAHPSVVQLPEDTLGLVLLVCFDGDATCQLTPTAVTVPRAKLEWCAANDRIDDLWRPWDPVAPLCCHAAGVPLVWPVRSCDRLHG